MNISNLSDRIRQETDLERFIGKEGVDYEVSSVRSRRGRARMMQGKMVVMKMSGPESKDEILDRMEEKKKDVGVFKIEFIVDDDDKAEWRSEQVSEEIKRLPYIMRERKMVRDADNGDEVIYVGEYAVDENWIED